jgi:glycosyltransferase 2 family protein
VDRSCRGRDAEANGNRVPSRRMGPTVTEKRPGKLERAGDIAARVSSLQPADPNLRRGLHAGIGIVVVLSVGLAVVAALGDFPDVDWRFRPLALLLALLAFVVYLIGSGEIWRRLMSALGGSLPPFRGQRIWFTSGLGRYVPTALLLPMLRMAMAEREGVPKRVTAAGVVYELALFFTASVIIGAYFVISLPDLEGIRERYVVLILPAIAVVAMQPRIFHTLADVVLKRMGRDPLPISLPGLRVLEFIALYAAACLAAGAGIYCLAQAVYPIGTDDIPTVVSSYAVANTVSILAFIIPGGLGAREASMAVALSPVMPTAPAVAIAVLSRILQVALEVLFASGALLLARRRPAEQ